MSYIEVNALELLEGPVVFFGGLPKDRLKHGLIQAHINRDVVEEGLGKDFPKEKEQGTVIVYVSRVLIDLVAELGRRCHVEEAEVWVQQLLHE